eukprot:TRINITY_DN4390_c0_g1_i1.p1 TRINITY_DN4390_c0_g1~~TRINITY_DN4390_c0_g1_i1.p1  ORF type:complete len:395 (+),score=49.14 TRINITY_DN4390_c0_g1_i1:873-2057(+)
MHQAPSALLGSATRHPALPTDQRGILLSWTTMGHAHSLSTLAEYNARDPELCVLGLLSGVFPKTVSTMSSSEARLSEHTANMLMDKLYDIVPEVYQVCCARAQAHEVIVLNMLASVHERYLKDPASVELQRLITQLHNIIDTGCHHFIDFRTTRANFLMPTKAVSPSLLFETRHADVFAWQQVDIDSARQWLPSPTQLWPLSTTTMDFNSTTMHCHDEHTEDGDLRQDAGTSDDNPDVVDAVALRPVVNNLPHRLSMAQEKKVTGQFDAHWQTKSNNQNKDRSAYGTAVFVSNATGMVMLANIGSRVRYPAGSEEFVAALGQADNGYADTSASGLESCGIDDIINRMRRLGLPISRVIKDGMSSRMICGIDMEYICNTASTTSANSSGRRSNLC